METYLVQENLAFFKSFPTVYDMPMLANTLRHVYDTLEGNTWTIWLQINLAKLMPLLNHQVEANRQ